MKKIRLILAMIFTLVFTSPGLIYAFWVNVAPVANAGPDQSVHAGDLVTLDASASYDPDESYPLIYSWEIISKPESSAATLLGPNSVSPSFVADVLGDYTIQLIVTDNSGLPSSPDEVCVSTFNSCPVANAGPDQSVVQIGTTVQLDGSKSWDYDGDPISYSWSIIALPNGSSASLSNSSSANPTFSADVHGYYSIQLVVSDQWSESGPDTVTVSFDNVEPVADAGNNQSVVQGDTVYLDGSESYDANMDPLNYSWSIVSKPTDSLTELEDPTSVQTNFIADVPGEYIISLVVNDGYVDSDPPSNITIFVLADQGVATEILQELVVTINALDDDTFDNPNKKKALTNKVNAVLRQIDQGAYEEALDKLENDILGKTDGCANSGSPDRNDWIQDCDSQNQVYPVIVQAIDLLINLI